MCPRACVCASLKRQLVNALPGSHAARLTWNLPPAPARPPGPGHRQGPPGLPGRPPEQPRRLQLGDQHRHLHRPQDCGCAGPEHPAHLPVARPVVSGPRTRPAEAPFSRPARRARPGGAIRVCLLERGGTAGASFSRGAGRAWCVELWAPLAAIRLRGVFSMIPARTRASQPCNWLVLAGVLPCRRFMAGLLAGAASVRAAAAGVHMQRGACERRQHLNDGATPLQRSGAHRAHWWGQSGLERALGQCG